MTKQLVQAVLFLSNGLLEVPFIVSIPSFYFEIQFHTEKSLEVKLKNHSIYQKNREKGIDKDQRNKNDLEMKNNMDEVVAPEEAEFMNRYSNEYIEALKKTIKRLQDELDTILADKEKLKYIDERVADTKDKS